MSHEIKGELSEKEMEEFLKVAAREGLTEEDAISEAFHCFFEGQRIKTEDAQLIQFKRERNGHD